MLFKAINSNKKLMQFGYKNNSLYLFWFTVYKKNEIQVI